LARIDTLRTKLTVELFIAEHTSEGGPLIKPIVSEDALLAINEDLIDFKKVPHLFLFFFVDF